MNKTVTRLMAAAAALGLVAAPIVAQANTRADASGFAVSTSNAMPGLGRTAVGEGQDDDEGGIGFGEVALGLAAAGLIIAGVVIAADNDDRASPGT